MMPHYVEPLFRPPSEAYSLIFQITIGCSHNKCSFCGMYKMKRFHLRPLDEILAEIRQIPERHSSAVERIFLADGDALIYPFERLIIILDTIAATFPKLTRVAAYASYNSIRTKSAAELALLRQKKLRILYLGLESGDDPTLDSMSKGCSADEMANEALKARGAGMKLSVTAILGIAGRSRSAVHARATAEWVNRVNPEYFSLLTLFHRGNEAFVATLDKCSALELMLEAREMLVTLNPEKTVLRSNHISNFMTLEGSYPKDRERLIAYVDSLLEKQKNSPGYFEKIAEWKGKGDRY